MGTRNLTMVIDQEGTKKVAQYGQWDGYPSRVGVGVLSFLKNEEQFGKLKKNLSKTRFLDSEGVDKEFSESYNKNVPQWSNEPDNRTEDQKKWFETYASRDLAESVLENIANSEDKEIILIDNEETAKGDGWVKYSYVIDLKENKLKVYGLLDQPMIKEFDLDNLPEKDVFVKELEENQEED